MKPFTVPFLKCTFCSTLDDLILTATEIEKIDVEVDVNFLNEKLHLFTNDNNKILNMLIENIKGGYEYKNDNDSLYKFLLGNEVISGYLSCPNCNTKYKIEDGIVNFLGGENINE